MRHTTTSSKKKTIDFCPGLGAAKTAEKFADRPHSPKPCLKESFRKPQNGSKCTDRAVSPQSMRRRGLFFDPAGGAAGLFFRGGIRPSAVKYTHIINEYTCNICNIYTFSREDGPREKRGTMSESAARAAPCVSQGGGQERFPQRCYFLVFFLFFTFRTRWRARSLSPHPLLFCRIDRFSPPIL